MARLPLFPALAVLALAAGALPAMAKTDPGATLIDDDNSQPQSMPDQIRDKLSADGYKDITVVPTSYVVSATDKEGKRVLLLVGPASSSKLPEQEPSTAQSPDDKKTQIQQ
jgi:hypothetical protein